MGRRPKFDEPTVVVAAFRMPRSLHEALAASGVSIPDAIIAACRAAVDLPAPAPAARTVEKVRAGGRRVVQEPAARPLRTTPPNRPAHDPTCPCAVCRG